jgi:hypothetical protein
MARISGRWPAGRSQGKAASIRRIVSMVLVSSSLALQYAPKGIWPILKQLRVGRVPLFLLNLIFCRRSETSAEKRKLLRIARGDVCQLVEKRSVIIAPPG